MPGWPDHLTGRASEVAPALLGAVVSHDGVSLRLTEVEAYEGAQDAGSHAFRGRTPRTAVMFGPPGRLYVYFTYGMHHCANLVVGPDGTAAAVLLRAGEVVDGLELARRRRPGARDRELARGPALLARTMGWDLTHNGSAVDLTPTTGAFAVRSGPRVGLRGAPDTPWRFWIDGDPTVSAYRPATTRERTTRPIRQAGPDRIPRRRDEP